MPDTTVPIDYSTTLNLPETAFPMRANLPRREPEFLRRWEELDVYGRLRAQRQGRPQFILHDGPPYANGDIHIGTAMNKVLKDFIVRYKTMRGYDVPYVPGWDTHGMPIEVRAIRELGIDRKSVDPLQLRAACREYAQKWAKTQEEQFRRLGVLADWRHPYLTLAPAYEAAQIRVFGQMARQGYIYRNLYPVYWCSVCETALAEAEVEFHEKHSPAIHVAFQVRNGRNLLPENAAVVIWTTTPWTLPANVAIAIHPEHNYSLVDTDRGPLLLASALKDRVLAELQLEQKRLIGEWRGAELEGVVCRHPLFDRESPLVLADYVSGEEGTGAVHTAPGHGQEDYETGRRYGLEVVQPLDDQGRFTELGGPFAGLLYSDANEAICRELDARGALLKLESITHPYAHCWRCRNPLIWRATEQWFTSVDGFRAAALAAIDEVNWIPAWGRDRIRNMVAARSDWCISRQRAWGVPLPIFYCRNCNDPLLTDASIEAVAELFGREGSDAWWRYDAAEILPQDAVCGNCGGSEFRKEYDTMDVWFDSGSSHAAVLETRPGLKWPADLYLEGSDQHRGWFQSSLLTAVATRGSAPYRSVLTHGFVMAADGRAMSKSLGNVVAPEEVIRQYGADVLRLWVASVDYRGDVRVSPDILRQTAEVYRKIRNTLRFLLANLNDFDPDRDTVAYADLPELDRWALRGLKRLVDRVTAAYEAYEYHIVHQALHTFCTVDMSSFYLDVCKDRLYAEPAASATRRAAQTVMYDVAKTIIRLAAPLIPYSADDAWQHLPAAQSAAATVHLTEWPELPEMWQAPDLAAPWQTLLKVRDDVARAVEAARTQGIIREPAAAKVELHTTDASVRSVLEQYEQSLGTYYRVAEVRLCDQKPAGSSPGDDIVSLSIRVSPTQYRKCARCWRYVDDVGAVAESEELCDRCARVLRNL